MWVCHFYNVGSKYHFGTEVEAKEYGERSGFEFTVYFEE